MKFMCIWSYLGICFLENLNSGIGYRHVDGLWEWTYCLKIFVPVVVVVLSVSKFFDTLLQELESSFFLLLTLG